MRITEEKAFHINLSRAELDSLVLAGFTTGQKEYEEFASRRNAKQPGRILPWSDIMDTLQLLDAATN